MVSSDRKKMIEDNIGLVHAVANRFRGRGAEYDDLFQSGCIGLIKAVDHFDPSRGFAFSTYAVPVIMGEIKRIFRDGGSVKVGRALKEKSMRAQALREKFTKLELREPTVSEMAEMLGCDLNETAEILNVISPTVSLNAFGEDGEDTFDIPVDESEQLFDRLSVLQLVGSLSDQERILVDLRFYKGLTQCKTAQIMGVSQVQVSRKEKAVLEKLRQKMTE